MSRQNIAILVLNLIKRVPVSILNSNDVKMYDGSNQGLLREDAETNQVVRF